MSLTPVCVFCRRPNLASDRSVCESCWPGGQPPKDAALIPQLLQLMKTGIEAEIALIQRVKAVERRVSFQGWLLAFVAIGAMILSVNLAQVSRNAVIQAQTISILTEKANR